MDPTMSLPEKMTIKNALLNSLEDLKQENLKSVRVWIGSVAVTVDDAMFHETDDGECVRLILPGEGKEIYARVSAITGVETDMGVPVRRPGFIG